LATEDVRSDRAQALTPGGGLEIYSLVSRHQLAPDTDNLGTVRAISAETGVTTWLYEQRAGTVSLMATGGGLVFGGDSNGRFRAFHDETGEILWEINLGSPVVGYPITYEVAGRQYVAVNTGQGATNLTPELRPSRGSSLFVFALPD
jgi:alcohol dehydrogenase (cytochrome c)